MCQNRKIKATNGFPQNLSITLSSFHYVSRPIVMFTPPTPPAPPDTYREPPHPQDTATDTADMEHVEIDNLAGVFLNPL